MALVSPRLAGRGEHPRSDMALTRREVEVLALLVQGYSDRDIADELFISPKTASVHVSKHQGQARREQPRRGRHERRPARPGEALPKRTERLIVRSVLTGTSVPYPVVIRPSYGPADASGPGRRRRADPSSTFSSKEPHR